jgi:glycerophosphoryl diester phosphodiesterase
MPDNSTSPWLAGLRLDEFPGPSTSLQIAQAAHSLGVDILSPEVFVTPPRDPMRPEDELFTTKEMVDEAHRLGLAVKPWTVRFTSSS